ncbi:SDR family NAD(P)-dependent oxidoreductase [Acetobacterium bakii]|nr:SDR family oxidoreductase [Acetobacterium bakii]
MFKNKNIMITGTNRGIGRTMLEAFAREGANIWAHARKETSEFTENLKHVSEINAVEIMPIFFDMTNSLEMKQAVKEISDSKKTIDVLVNNAGIAHGGLFQMTSLEKMRDVFDVNYFSVLELTQLISRLMVRQKKGSIINIASISGLDLKAGNCAYGTSKAALIAATKVLSYELAPQGIRVNAIAPGLTDTNMTVLMEKKAGDAMVRETALNRLGLPEEIAQTAIFLASDKASFITGQTLRVDGGM